MRLTAQDTTKAYVRDTVKAGIYITSIHDIDFKQKEYAIDLWLWLRYKNKALDFVQNMEVPQAKTVVKSFSTIDSSNGEMYLLMKLQCVMKDSWKIDNFPFDNQKLRFSIENSQFETKSMVFVIDSLGQHFDPRFTLNGWHINKLAVSTDVHVYETAFGDKTIIRPHTEYSSFKVRMEIDRKAFGLFWKMFLGMYVAFFISFMCFFIHIDHTDSRFSLSVGSLFAAIGNKYIIDASLPETVTFTLVDTLHCMTMVFILAIIISNVYSLQLKKNEKLEAASRFDSMAAKILLFLYLVLNAIFIGTAMNAA
jgi:hypothetical protein